MTPDTFIAKGLRVERRHDRWNGTSYMAWKPHVSMLFFDTKELLRFINLPAKTPTGDALRAWLKTDTPPTPSPAVDHQSPPADPQPPSSLSHELQATGFGPECHDIDSDPTHNTRTII